MINRPSLAYVCLFLCDSREAIAVGKAISVRRGILPGENGPAVALALLASLPEDIGRTLGLVVVARSSTERKKRVKIGALLNGKTFSASVVHAVATTRCFTMNTQACLDPRGLGSRRVAVRLSTTRFASFPSAPCRERVILRSRAAHRHGQRLHTLPALAAKKKDDVDPVAEREAALQRREAELWARQSELYERALEELKELKAMYGEERSMWMSREVDLMKENDALRSKLMYVVSQAERGLMGADWVDGTAATGEIPAVVGSRDGAEDVGGGTKGVDATARGVQTRTEATETGERSSSPSSVAADFAAAFAAVEHGDVLNDDVLFAYRSDGGTPETVTEPATEPVTVTEPQAATAPQAPSPATPALSSVKIPTGPPPSLTVGDDDIYWMNQLHVALVDEGYFPGDEDIDDFFFGSQTQSALLTFQACSGLEETGCADMPTWKALLGDDLVHKTSRDLTEDMNPLTERDATTSGNDKNDDESDEKDEKKPFAELFSAETYEVKRGVAGGGAEATTTTTTSTHVHDEKFFADGHVEVTDVVSGSTTSSKRTRWPTVLEGEGGQVVHALHVLLTDAGYYPDDDELQWWQFGDTTITAIKTFEACNGMPETGTCNERLWKMLAGDDADPSIVDTLKSGKSDDEDLSLEGREGMVWLIGEQRWADRRP